MKTFEKFHKSSTTHEIDEAQGFSSFVGKTMGFARKVKNIATTGSLNKPADSIKNIAKKAADRAKSAPNSPFNPKPTVGKVGSPLRNNPQAKAKAIEARSVANNPSKPKQNTDSAPSANPSSRPTSSAIVKRPESKGVRVSKEQQVGAAVKKKVGDYVKSKGGIRGMVQKATGNVASKSAYRTDDKGKDLDDKLEKTGKDKKGRDKYQTKGRPTIGGIRAALQSKGARELGSKLNTVRKNLPTADDYRTGNEGSGFGFGGRFKGRSLKMVGDALGKDGKKFEKTKVVDRKGVGKGKSKKVIVRGRELDAEGKPIEKKKDTSFKGQAKDALRRAAGITDKKKVDKVEDKPEPEKVTTPGSNKVVGKPPKEDGGSKAPVPAKPKKPSGEGGAEAPLPAKKDPEQERETDRPQADEGDRLDPKTGRRITKKFPDKIKPPRKPQPYSKTLGTKKPDKETPKLPAAKVPAEKKKEPALSAAKETPKEKSGELAKVKGGELEKVKTPASKSKAPEKEKAIVPSSKKPESKSEKDEYNVTAMGVGKDGDYMSKKDRIAAFKANRDKRRKESTEKVLSNKNVKALSPAKKEETPKKEPVTAKRRSVKSKEFKNEDGTFNQKKYDDAKGRVETKKGGGRPKKDAKDSGAEDTFSNKSIKNAPDTSKVVRDPKTGEQIANPTSSGKSSEDGTQLKGVKDDKLDSDAKTSTRRRNKRFSRTPAAQDAADEASKEAKSASSAVDPSEKQFVRKKRIVKKETTKTESYSHWREEFIWETDKKYPEKVKEIKPMTGKNTITINPEDETAKYKRGY